ncbi:hypothetical protein D3C87_1184800 [compost metagenome]
MDFVDNSTDLEQRFNDLAVEAIRAQTPRKIAYSGTCYNPNCGLDVHEPRIFCDANCRDEYDEIKRLRKLNG